MIVHKTHIIILTALVILAVSIYLSNDYIIERFENGTYAMPEKILVINLEKRPDRYDNFMKYFKNMNNNKIFTVERVDAVDGSTQDWRSLLSEKAIAQMEDYLKTGIRKSHPQLSVGAIGCYLSHLKAMEQIVRENKPMLVCEDDLEFPKNFVKKLRTALKNIPYRSDALILFHLFCSQNGLLKCKEIGNNILDVYRFQSTLCMYITPEVAKICLDNLRPLQYHIDAALSKLRQDDKIYIYASRIVNYNTTFDSDTNSDVKEFLPIIRL